MKKLLSLLLTISITLGLFTFCALADGTTETFISGNSRLTVTVTDADIVSCSQDGTSITIYLTGVVNDTATISAVGVPQIVYSGTGAISLTDGKATTSIQLKPAPNAQVMAV